MGNFSNFILAGVTLLGVSATAQEKIIFQEDFNGDSLNMSIWNYEEGDGCPNLCGWGNNEEQIYDRKYVEVKNGNLIITALKNADPKIQKKLLSLFEKNEKNNFEEVLNLLETANTYERMQEVFIGYAKD